jgi:hypothetical protein
MRNSIRIGLNKNQPFCSFAGSRLKGMVFPKNFALEPFTKLVLDPECSEGEGFEGKLREGSASVLYQGDINVIKK